MSYEARDAIKEWLKTKDSRRKPRTNEPYPKDMVFGFNVYNFEAMWRRALEKAGFDKRDSETRIHIYHVHTLRKFFSTQMSLDGVSRDIYEAWMGHKRYLDEAYHRYSLEQLGNIYEANMDAVSIYGGAGVSDFEQKLDAIEKEVKEKDEELRKVNEMLDKLGIPNVDL